jgi:hypothetical protein
MAVDRKQFLLGGLAVAVVLAVVWMMQPAAPTPAGLVAPPSRAGDPRAGKAQPAGEVGPVKLGSLNTSAPAPGEAARNPFRFQPRVVAPPPTPTGTAPAIEAARPPPAPGPPPVPPIPLKFIGVLERANGVKWAVLTDGKSPTPLYGKDGDIIDGRYVIVKIGTESVEMTHADGRGRQVIRLTGQ